MTADIKRRISEMLLVLGFMVAGIAIYDILKTLGRLALQSAGVLS